MSFRSLSSVLRKRKFLLNTHQDANQIIAESLQNFLPQFTLRHEYHPKHNSLIIQSPSKTVANELVFKLPELGALLRGKGVFLSRIIIR